MSVHLISTGLRIHGMARFALLILVGLLGTSCATAKENPKPVKVPANVDNGAYTRLLKKYVDERGLVAYGAWKNNAQDMAALDQYLQQFAKAGDEAKGEQKAAGLINAYNAFTLQWILQNYPTESIWSLDDSFTASRHEMFGEKVSLNDIEKGTLIPQIGWKDHSVLVCAARSCPPLRREAYRAEGLDDQIADAYRRWLARPDLNEYFPAKDKVEISSIFKWYKDDFEKVGGPKHILTEFGPAKFHDFLSSGKYEIDYKSYNWGLNDQGEHGRNYSKVHLFFDNIF
ncbi:hypothetical protein BH20VER3_BH20VER3_21500 [soil metagenome]